MSADQRDIEAQQYAEAARQMLEQGQEAPCEHVEMDALGGMLLAEFAEAERDRIPTEERWLKDLRQYKGRYDPEVEALIGSKRSRVFVRKTRVKVKTTDSRVADLVFPAGRERNWDLAPTPKPRLSEDQVIEIKALAQAMAQAQQLTLNRELLDRATLEWAKERAARMATVIRDQLVESRYKAKCLQAIHSGHLYGTGIIKGPLVERKIRSRFIRNGGKWQQQSVTFISPFVDYVPVWRFYPDMSATELEGARYVYERHAMTRADIAALATRKSFNQRAIREYIEANPRGFHSRRHFEEHLREIGDRTVVSAQPGTYELLERWGWLTGEQLATAGVNVPRERRHEAFFSNVWLLPTGKVIKAVLQPINGVTWPYHLYHFDKDEASIFGEGIPSVMRDEQVGLNAATRLMYDNAGITSGPQLEVTPSLLMNPDRVDEHHPWKVWLRNATSPGTAAVRAIELPSRLNELGALKSMAESNADEVTAIPRYMSGENVTSGAAGTAAGMSMLMGAVNIVIKDLVTSYDEGVTEGFIRGLYHWNMQFHEDDSIKGDFDVTASGAASLVAKEVRARQINELAAATANPMDAPFVKRDVLNRRRAEALELPDVIKTEDEVKADSQSQMAQMQQQMQLQAQQLALAEAQARVANLEAQAAATQAKMQATIASIDETVARTIERRVAAAYAALQAGGVATASPFTAPAGDEILRSAGWKDFTPDPSIAQLGGPPVQAQAIPGSQPVTPGQAPVDRAPVGTEVDRADADVPQIPMAPDLQPQTGQVGLHGGIETTRIEGPAQ